ncbi:MAG: ATP-binding protein, partial [Actinomycetota bacterium]|nr:ATP-binding protein [Actinomycetota bacterium]
DAHSTTGAELRSVSQPDDASTGGEQTVDDEVVVDDFTLPSEPGNERAALARVEEAIADMALPSLRLEGLKTAVAEATMNAIEHGNKNQPELPVHIRVLASADAVTVTVTDVGGLPVDAPQPSMPDLEAKLAGLQTPRGWGLFLIKNMVDEMNVSADGEHHTVSLTVRLHESPAEDHDAKHL